MNCSRRKFPTRVRVGIAALVLGTALLAASCGKDGSIYGSISWDGYLSMGSFEGFPSSGSSNTYYKINEGTYNIYYTLTDLTYYYPGYYVPGHATDETLYYSCTYTVTANKGSFLSDGKDKSFDLYLAYDGLYKYGDVRSVATPNQDPTKVTPRLGTQSWTQNGLLITVTTEI